MIRSEDEEAFWAPASAGKRGITNTMQQSLMAILNRRLNFQVQDIEIWRSDRSFKEVVAVRFKNGHILKTTPADARSEEFLAACVLVYDLPPKR